MANLCKIFLVGAGQIGSRHLQALARVKIPLEITVIEPIIDAVTMAKNRLAEINGNKKHSVVFLSKMPKNVKKVDLVIVATTSRDRRKVIEEILGQATVRYFILEKLLFQKKKDFNAVEKLLKHAGAQTFVNCMMRTIPFYNDLKTKMGDDKLIYMVNRADTGIATGAIHYLDHIAFLTGCFDFNVDTSLLRPTVVESKRKGYLELNGTLRVQFKNGATFIFNNDQIGCPPEVIIYNSNVHTIVREAEQKALMSLRAKRWQWQEVPAIIPYQSVMTTGIVEEILTSGTCPLVQFSDAVKLHLPFLETLLKFVNTHSEKKYGYYPFT
ncbi:MAG: hypothetical protein A3H68_03150 [Candidatus Taylorbacteria bacterium RIFCSPLOWO2_02_FULL_46_40]|uniref:Gfo/Idh/MocA-like oxidoreductase N-terminal domain-containing protein n=1 Tax=Candidatus Taylorbacteria bacterium RIFCSPLOWO2_02_FULL_46_40 TaxID=1802329 RepID=A0A1G2P159_9BACT|nr:MAG: hypothetical protein A3H68_03150 [Candidatus Taylorbacteria bacterium RIFCSPLOWO2_02_FULL_46_40]